ncbi:MAG: DUF192 domain-containing protein [Acidimicrobiia bacterium]|nr:DUF192 domain-containing protein [Acidimicrobiia bacterium]
MGRPSFLDPLRIDPVVCRLLRVTDGQTLAGRILPAFDSRGRRRGLIGRAGLDADEALIISPTKALHTWFMRFPIDIAFVSRDGTVLKTRHAVTPWRVTACARAHAAVELPAGTLVRRAVRPGDVLLVAAGSA